MFLVTNWLVWANHFYIFEYRFDMMFVAPCIIV